MGDYRGSACEGEKSGHEEVGEDFGLPGGSEPLEWSRVFMGAGHVAPLPGMVPKPQTPRSKAGSGINHLVCAMGVVTWSFCCHLGMVGSLPNSKFPDASRGPTLRTGLSEDNSRRHAVSTLSCTISSYSFFFFYLNIVSLRFIHVMYLSLVSLLNFPSILLINI